MGGLCGPAVACLLAESSRRLSGSAIMGRVAGPSLCLTSFCFCMLTTPRGLTGLCHVAVHPAHPEDVADSTKRRIMGFMYYRYRQNTSCCMPCARTACMLAAHWACPSRMTVLVDSCMQHVQVDRPGQHLCPPPAMAAHYGRGDQEGEQPLGIQHWCGDKTRISWTVLHDNNARVPASAAVFLSNGRLLQREGKQGW